MGIRLRTVWALLLMLPLSGCEKETERLEDYLVDFATVVQSTPTYRFLVDSGHELIPIEINNYTGKEGQRVLLNYEPLSGDTIRIRSISDIYTGKLEMQGYPDHYFDDPVKIQSVWVGGDYLNLIFETEYHDTPHSIALYVEPASQTLNIHFSHSSNDDPPGYPKMMYASFSLSALHNLSEEHPIAFQLFINTYTGTRAYQLEY